MKFSIHWNLTGQGRPTRIGSTVLPGEFTARWEFPDDHTVELDIRTAPVGVDDTKVVRPVCEAIRIMRHPDRPPLSGTELRRLPLKNWVEFACVEAGLRQSPDGAWEPIEEEPERRAALEDIQESRRRRRITDELLETVATIFDEAGGDIEELRRKMSVSKAQAYRYVRLARERGFLPAEDAS